MKRTFGLALGVVAAAALVGGLVHAVLVAADLAEPAAATVYGVTSRRLWATAVGAVALVGVVFGIFSRRRGAIVSLLSGLVGMAGGGLLLAIADGGPGSGNGVVGAAGAVVLGVIAMGLGAHQLVRQSNG